METLLHAPGWLLEALLRPFDLLPPWLALVATAVLSAWPIVFVLRHTSPQGRLEVARDRMAAAVYEMRLFLDAPRRVLAAQARFLAWMAAYLLCLVPPMLVLALPFGLLLAHLELRHGRAPIAAPADVVMRIELAPGIDSRDVTIRGDPAIAMTAPILYAPDQPAAYARLHVQSPGVHQVSIRVRGIEVTKSVVADPSARRVAPERRAGIAHLWALAFEPPLPAGAVRAVSVPYPGRPHRWFGVSLPWWTWWLAISLITSLALAKRRGVAI